MGRPVTVLHAVISPAQRILGGSIVLHKHTWEGHIGVNHPEVEFSQLSDTLGDPDYIASSTEVPGDYVFICEGNVNEWGDPLVVPVRTDAANCNFVTTAYYDQNYVRHGPILWRRGDG